MRRFKSAGQAQQFLSVYNMVQNLFQLGRHLLRGRNHRLLRMKAFVRRQQATYVWQMNEIHSVYENSGPKVLM